LTENSGKKTVRQKNVGFLQSEESQGANLIGEREKFQSRNFKNGQVKFRFQKVGFRNLSKFRVEGG